MTKMQIIAKAILTVLGIYVILHLCRIFLGQYVGPEREVPMPALVMLCTSFALSVALVAFYMVVNNDSLAIRITGPVETADPHSEVDWLFAALRLVCSGHILPPQCSLAYCERCARVYRFKSCRFLCGAA